MRSGFPWLSHNASLICIANAGSRPGGRVLSCYTTRKKPKKRTPPHRPSGLPSLRSAEPAGPETRFAQTAVPDYPGSTNLRSAAQKGVRTALLSAPLPCPLPPREREQTQLSLPLGCPPPFQGEGWGRDGVQTPSGSLSGGTSSRGCPGQLSERSEFWHGRLDVPERR